MIYSVMYDQKFLKNAKNWKKSQKNDHDDFQKIKKALKEIPTIFQLSDSSQILTLHTRDPTMSIL